MRLMLTVLTALVVVSPVSLRPTMAQDDGRLIEGRWRPVKLTIPGQHKVTPAQLENIVLTFEDGQYTSTGGPQVERGTYELDPAKEPRWITMTVRQGATAGSTVHGIYNLTAERLTIVYPLQPGAPRPTKLPTQGAGSWVVVEYVRID